MPRIKIDLPKQFSFTCSIPVRISDVNYGGHVGNDTVLTLFHGSLMLMSNRFGVLAWTNHSLIFTYFILYILFVDRMVEIRKQSRTGWHLALLLILILGFNQVLSLSESLIIKAPVLHSAAWRKFR